VRSHGTSARRSRLLAGIVVGVLSLAWLSSSHAQEDVAARYARATTLARSGATEAALAEFDALLADFPSDADYLLGRAQMLTRLGDDAAAIETAERALRLAPDYEDVWRLRWQLAQRAEDSATVAALRARASARFPTASWWRSPPAAVEYRRWLSSGFGAERLSNDAPDWSREFVRLDWQARTGATLFGELSRSERFEAADRALNVGGSWQVLPEWQLGAALGVTEDARFLPERELSVDAMRAWADGWGTTFGFRQRDYASGDVSSYSFTGEKYVADFRIAYRLDRSRLAGGDSALTHALSLTWYGSDRRNLGVTLGAGEEIETIGLDRLLRTSISNVTFTGNEKLSPRLALNWWLGTHEQGDFYRRSYAGLGVRVGL
jgi:YaiO family outer membrane protein